MKENGIYIIQKHDATRLHYDLRLEINDVLKSWVIPKSPPLKEGIKRLAVQTKDHQLSYAEFEGEIPEGEYGAGKVEIWDYGDFKILEFEENKIVIDIKGQKLIGKYCLIKLKTKLDKKNWLFFKKKN